MEKKSILKLLRLLIALALVTASVCIAQPPPPPPPGDMGPPPSDRGFGLQIPQKVLRTN